MVWMHIVTTKRQYVTNISKNRLKFFSHVFTICLKCTFGKRNQLQFIGTQLTTTHSKSKKARSIILLGANFAIVFSNLRKHEQYVSSWCLIFAKSRWNRGQDKAPEHKDELIYSCPQRFFLLRFFSKWTCKFHLLSKHGYVLPTHHLLPETYRCSQIWPTSLSYGFIGVV